MSSATATESRILSAFLRRTPTSARLAQEAAGVFPSGITHDSRLQRPYGIYIRRAAGSRKWDLDGNEYVDYSGGHGALLLGHNHPEVVAACQAQLQRGTHFGACHELEVRWGQLVQRLVPCAQRVRFTSSGTEATLLALRVARACTGRSKVLRFRGHFHGWHDHVAFGVASHFDGTPTPGVLKSLAEDTLLADSHDASGTRQLIESRNDIAAVIIEPTGASWGQVPVTSDFLGMLREVTAARGIALIFDEVISGFRASPGGAQGHYGITPDLATLAKIIAGGLPGGALAGRTEYMDILSFSQPGGREKVPHQGTFNANPLSAAAGIATLELVATGEPCRRANDYAARLREALRKVVRDSGLPFVVYGSFSGFHIFSNPRSLPLTAEEIESGRVDYKTLKENRGPDFTHLLRLAMLIQGVELFGWPGGPTSAVHTDEDLDLTANALGASLKMLKEEGAV